MTTAKTGAEHLAALRDGRQILIGGQVITDHVDHPSFRRVIRTAASLYDYNAAPHNIERMTFDSPTAARRVSLAWQLPTTYDELVKRREALEETAALTGGWIGRTPDHVASTLSAMMMSQEFFNSHGRRHGAAIQSYFTWARDNDVWCGYALVPPQTTKWATPGEPKREFVNAGVCDEDQDGITIKGARLLSTGIPMAQELLVGAVEPLRPGDEKYSFTAMIPLSNSKVKILSRRSYEEANPSPADYPLSSHFDENDAIVYFDEVKIPWERVFVHGDVQVAQDQWYKIPVMSYQNYPAQIRLSVKLRYLLGLVRRMVEANGSIASSSVQEMLGQMAAEVSIVEGMVHAMEIKGENYGKYFLPNSTLQYSSMVFSQQLYGSFINRIRELTGGGMIAVPSSMQDLHEPHLGKFVEMTQGSPRLSADKRARLFKLGWDSVGSEFASRHAQYEIFYAGPTSVSRMRTYRSYNWEKADKLVENMLQRTEV